MIGDWNNDGCVFGCFPRCLRNGSAIESYGIDTLADGTIYFPIYRGPESNGTELHQLWSYIEYNKTEGVLQPRFDAVFGANTFFINFNSFGNTVAATTWTTTCWVEIDVDYAASGVSWTFFDVSGTFDGLQFYLRKAGATGDVPVLQARWGTDLDTNISTRGATPITSGLWHFGMVKQSDGMCRLYINGNEESSYLLQEAWNGTVDVNNDDFGLTSQWGEVATAERPTVKHHAFILYNTEKSDSEILDEYLLGPTLGGLVGFSSADRQTMELKPYHPPSSTETSISIRI